jgi:UDP-glucose 4-epimerase
METSSVVPSSTHPAVAAESVRASSFDASRFYDGRRVLVTGGLGFIGSNIARRLVDLNARVCVVDALTPNSGANRFNLSDYSKRLELRVGSIADPDTTQKLVRDQDVIFNLAGNVSHLDSMQAPLVDLEANVRSQMVLLEACRFHAPNARIVFASTRQIYGRPSYLPVDEEHPLLPVDVNGVNKMAGEAYHTLYQRVYGLSAVPLRLTNVFGPRMRIKDARLTFLGIWLRRVVEDEEFEIWGGEQKRDLTYIDDVVDAFLAAGSPEVEPGRPYNVGGGPPVTLRQLAEVLVGVAGKGSYAVKPFPVERARIDIGDYFANDARFRAATGWQPRVSLTDGLRHSLNYYDGCLDAYI